MNGQRPATAPLLPVPVPTGHSGPCFDQPIPANGYGWWYLDAFTPEHRFGLTVIGFVGSVFSPYYARARRRQPTDPSMHAAINVCLYGPGARRWVMTERGRLALSRDAHHLQVGDSRMHWHDGRLTIDIDERTAPWRQRVRGQIRVTPEILTDWRFTLDAHAHHHWTPTMPRATVEVHFQQPALRWQGSGYMDGNTGGEPIERGFKRWHWSRGELDRDAVVLYQGERRDGSTLSMGLRFGEDGLMHRFALPAARRLPASGWRIDRQTQVASDRSARVLDTLLDTPFYARSLIEHELFGTTVRSMHETLDLDRFATRWVQTLLPFRTRRVR
jgi:carotenoid 1,2-hydratase